MISQAYVSQLASIKQEALREAGVNLVIVGCGDYQLIKDYKGELPVIFKRLHWLPISSLA
jgi:hypothetical protein